VLDTKALAGVMAGIVKEHVERATAPLLQRIADMEATMADEITKRVQEAIAAIPLPKDGKDGMDGKDGEAGPEGKPGRDGQDGVGVTGALIDKDGNLVLTLGDGRSVDLGRVHGKDGMDGATFTLDDFDIEQTDERSFKFAFTKGEFKHSFEFEIPFPLYKGVFQAGQQYARGDTVTWGGSLWHCDDADHGKPGEKGWTLCVKKGRDAK
jgi:integrin beta 3